jgi:hypothetical protein
MTMIVINFVLPDAALYTRCCLTFVVVCYIFQMLGYTDLNPDDFVYFKTPGGRWVAASEDDSGRLFMVDEIGDLYYDSGDEDIGLYAVS